MKKINVIFALLVVFVATSCSTLRTSYDYDKQVDFGKYKTFAFHKEGMDRSKLNAIDKKRFISAITVTLEAKGLVKNTENPDFLVNVIVKGKERIDVSENYPYGYGWWYTPSVSVRQYTENTILIDLIDTEKKVLVWQGIGTGQFGSNVEDRDAYVLEAVHKILENYPYGRK